jgi:hypothetical protein
MGLEVPGVSQEETLLRVARVPQNARTSDAVRWAAVTLAREEGRGRCAVYLFDREGIPLEACFRRTLEEALELAKELAGPMRWGECSIRTSARLRLDPRLIARCAPA